ncbi:MAG TPA: carboxypeptidase-like regulatory domain-containing protein [Bryobacteraceae bacterium]|nr:carboxypeptidase-like regulatory domain-containing protein [Bryobacteraceae bacterium]
MNITRSGKGTAALLCAGVVGLALFLVVPTHAQQAVTKKAAKKASGTSHYVSPPGYITGTVTSDKGPEAGVWVIAETNDFQTKMIKIVVTNDQGRYTLPELPTATYKVWVRGYGLLDSTPVDAKPGTTPLALKADSTKTPQEAARVYPGDYWLSMMAPPPPNMFPGTGVNGNGTGLGMLTQDHWINSLKSGCNFCHQLGTGLTRDLKHVFAAKPELKTDEEAWEWRLGVGVRGTNMYSLLGQMGQPPTLKSLSDWTRAMEAGQVPDKQPSRPQGIERNVVATLWDVGDDHSFMHDQISTDKQNPTINGGGPNYAVNAGHGQLVIMNQDDNSTVSLDIPTRDPKDKVPSRFPSPNRPSMFWGNEHLWSNPPYDPADPHNPMIDSKGRVWMTSKIRANADATWCSDPTNKYADWFPLRQSARQASYYDPKTKQFTLIDTCYSTHHLQFDNDPDETVYFNELGGPMFGWIDSKVYDETHDEQKANGWCGQVLDTNGDGKITRPFQILRGGRVGDASILYSTDTAAGGNQQAAGAPAGGAPGGGRGRGRGAPTGVPADQLDPKMDTLVAYNLYAIIPSPVDDSVWGVSESPFPGMLVRLQRGSNPPETCKTQVFQIPSPGYDPRGVDVDTNGVVWTGLAASSDLASFDVRKCKDLNGPAKIDGSQCKEGWTLYRTTGPRLKGTDIPADFHYFNWVDQQNVIGLGKNTPFLTGSNSDSLIALNPQTKKWTYFKVPYPLGFYSRGMDARIDDPNLGWKGRALYSNYGTHFVWHIEGGKGTKGKVVKFQLRPDPLAR